jgi:hypothetical protein
MVAFFNMSDMRIYTGLWRKKRQRCEDGSKKDRQGGRDRNKGWGKIGLGQKRVM